MRLVLSRQSIKSVLSLLCKLWGRVKACPLSFPFLPFRLGYYRPGSMATVSEVPKMSHCRWNSEIWQKISDKQSFKRQARDGTPVIEFCILRNINTKEEMNFQHDVEVVIIQNDNITTFANVTTWRRFGSRGAICVKVPADEKFNSVTEKGTSLKLEDDRFVELL